MPTGRLILAQIINKFAEESLKFATLATRVGDHFLRPAIRVQSAPCYPVPSLRALLLLSPQVGSGLSSHASFRVYLTKLYAVFSPKHATCPPHIMYVFEYHNRFNRVLVTKLLANM